MRVFAVVDEHGLPVGFYPEDIYPADSDGTAHSAIPESAKEVALEQYVILRDANGTKCLIGGEVVDYSPPPAKEPVPDSVTQTQLMQQLAILGVITWPECLAYLATGSVPAAFREAIDKIPDALQRNMTESRFIGADSFARNSDVASLLGKDAQYLDALWTEAAKL